MDDADGHLIYHPGDILQARCTHHFVMFSLAYYISMFCMRKYSWEKICPNLCVFSELYLYFFVFYSLVGLSPNIWCFFQFHLNWIEKKSNGWQIHVFWSEERIGCQILSTYWLFFFSSNSYFSISQHSKAHILQQPDYNEIPHVQMLGIEYSSDLMPYTRL